MVDANKDCNKELCYQMLREYVDIKCAGIEKLLDEKIKGAEDILDEKIQSSEKAFCVAKEQQEKRLVEAREALSKRLDGMNEFRGSLEDQRSTFLTRTEYNLMHEKIVDDVKELRTFKDEMTGKASQSSVNLATFLGIGGLVLALAGIIIAIVLH